MRNRLYCNLHYGFVIAITCILVGIIFVFGLVPFLGPHYDCLLSLSLSTLGL